MKESILLLHGALGTQAQFDSLKSILADQFTIHTMDFEGHGAWAATAPFTMQRFTQNVIDYLNEQQIVKIHLFGYSMGGYVALQVAKEMPEKVDRVMTFATKFDWTPESAAKETRMLNPEKIAAKVPAFARSLEQAHQGNDWKGVLNRTADMMIGLGNGNGLQEEDMRQIQHDVQVTVGSNDRMVGSSESSKWAAFLPQGRFMELDGFEHVLLKNDQSSLAKVMTDFYQAP